MNKFLLVIIVFIAGIIRLAYLDSIPAGFNADEAALGYNAYSLLLTGKDEHANAIPINLESFADFKPALYAYALVPLLFLGLPLNEFTVRLPSAIVGTLTILAVYFLVKILLAPSRLATNIKKEKSQLRPEIISSILLAISPWHIHFSRGAWEVNIATAFICLFFILLFRFVANGKKIFIYLSLLMGILSMYSYQSTRIVFPLIAAFTFILLVSKKLISFTGLFRSVVFCVILLIPLGLSLVSTDASSRLSGVGLLADEGPLSRVNEMRGHYADSQNYFARAMHNKITAYSLQFVRNYLSHFEPTFLFISGDRIDRSRVPETGQFHLIEALLIPIGALFAIKIGSKNWQMSLLLIWVICAPLASAMTFQTPHALRSHNLSIPLTVLSSLGLYFVISVLTKYKKPAVIIGVMFFGSIYIFLFARYIHQYTIHSPYDLPRAWQYGFRQVAEYVSQNQDRYQSVIMTDRSDQPYILFLFYLQYPPAQFQTNHSLTVRDKFNFSTVEKFDKYEFTDTDWDKVRDRGGSLIITFEDEVIDPGVHFVKTIKYPNGNPAFRIISN